MFSVCIPATRKPDEAWNIPLWTHKGPAASPSRYCRGLQDKIRFSFQASASASALAVRKIMVFLA